MRGIQIFSTAEEYVDDFLARGLPEESIRANDFYRRLIGWVIDHRSPLLYEQDHPDEYTNLSINFNWLLLRNYAQTKLGPPQTILSMYVLHELAHMTHWLPTRFDELSAGEYADQFTRSEYRASNETEILIHFRIPSLRATVFPDQRIVADVLHERGINQPAMERLCNLRPLFVEDTVLDGFFTGPDAGIAARFKRYAGNREWARSRFGAIRHYFSTLDMPQGSGLTNAEYEDVLHAYEPLLTQAQYEQNMIINVRFGYAMCGLAIPTLSTFSDAQAAAKDLEGQHAIVQS
jgi:hypothetical protein